MRSVDYKRGQPIVPDNHPLKLPAPEFGSPSSPFSPLSIEHTPLGLAPDTVQLLGGLRDLESRLQYVCTELDYELLSSSLLDTDYSGTPFVTPHQRFAEASHFTADVTFPSAVKFSYPHSDQVLSDPVDNETDYGDFEDMSSLQLAVVGSSNRWDGSQGTGYWKYRPRMKEAITGQTRGRGGNMQAADQLGVLENLVEPTSGAADWLSRVIEFLQSEIVAANRDVFPSSTLTDELSVVCLGHLHTNQVHKTALRNSLAKALPLEAIVMAGDYTPSRASGMLVPVPRAAVIVLSDRDVQLKHTLERTALSLEVELEMWDGKVAQQLVEVRSLKSKVAKATNNLEAAKAAAEAGSATSEDVNPPVNPPVVPPAPPAESAAVQLQQILDTLREELADAELEMQDVSKQRRSVFSTHLQGLQHLKLLDPPAQPRAHAETVKAFMHPTLARLCTAHDCILLKVFAIMDIVYGIGTALQQVKFSELKQGKGVGVAADEGVREFSARIRMHVQSSLDIDPNLAHVQFFAGLADTAVADLARTALQLDGTRELNLESATTQVLLYETRQLDDLKLRAANGDSAASSELKRRAAMGTKKVGKDTKPADTPPKTAPKPQRDFHPDPNHPEGKCRLPGHDTKKGHSNRECVKGGNAAYTQQVAAMVTAIPNLPYNPYAATAVPTMSNAEASEPMAAAIQQLVHAFTSMSHKGRGFQKTNPIATGRECTICGYLSGHPNGFCYYEYPDKSPTWRPTTNARKELLDLWTLRRQQRNLPPLAPRQVPPRYQPAANLVYLGPMYPMYGPVAPSAPMLPAPAPMPMLPSPLDPMVNVAHYNHNGGPAILSAVAQLDLPSYGYDSTAVVGAVMPRSFLQYQLPPATTTVTQGTTGDTGATAGAPNAGPAPEGAGMVDMASAGGGDGENKRGAEED